MAIEKPEPACTGQDPALFDHNRFPEARAALAFCGICPLPEECIQIVRPQKSSFDGVAGNVVWRNGYRVRHDNSTREDRFIQLRQERTA